MRGIELCEEFYYKYGKDAIENELGEYSLRIAAGISGEGSECLGFDDLISEDHDFEPGFCLWITKEDYDKFGFELERIYRSLPKEYAGYKRLTVSPVGGARHGVMIIDDFYTRFLGTPSAPSSLEHWLAIPHEALAMACNGKVFFDGLGRFTEIRNELLKGYPKDVRLKKIAAHTIMMAQSGLYNYNRCVSRGENGAAQLCVFEFVKNAISVIYLINNKYEPFYKWAYRGLRDLKRLSFLEGSLVALTELGNSKEEANAKAESMEEIANILSMEYEKEGLIKNTSLPFEMQAYEIQNKISDSLLRNMHIMDGI